METEMPAPKADTPLLQVSGLGVEFQTRGGIARVLDDVGFALGRGQTLGLVGESGCGKSMTALAMMRLIPTPPGRITSGQVVLDGQDLLALPEPAMRQYRGNRISMIFQEPMTSLNPAYTVGDQIGEAVRLHQGLNRKAAIQRAVEMLDAVGIPAAASRVHEYPHQFSGGMRQRVMIAMALACEPALLIADEPTTALDVTIQAQILELLRELQQRLGMAILIITHDLGVIAELVDEVIVMYAGQIVESAPVAALFSDPQHPYTIGLLGSIPRLDVERERLATIEGTVPSPANQPVGCRFAPRCPFADSRCHAEPPPLRALGVDHQVACWKAPVESIGGAA
jgi:peptide/nickel transport system ATP-binding protein/oligopeptide transport system ATP-binding protein